MCQSVAGYQRGRHWPCMQRMMLFAVSTVVLTVFWTRLCWLLWA